MKFFRALILLLSVNNLMAQADPEFRARTRNVAVPESAPVVLALHLKPGFVSALRLDDAVNSIAIGDPMSFRAEHSDAEPELVFFKPLTSEAARSNALVTTKSGEQISVTLSSAGEGTASTEIDFLVNCRRPSRLLLVTESPVVGVAETRALSSSAAEMQEPSILESILQWQSAAKFPDRNRGMVQAAVGRAVRRGPELIVGYSVRNGSDSAIELLPPQIELSSADRHGQHHLTSEPLPISAYRMSTRTLRPGERADGVVAFERPAFKESQAGLELRLAQSEQIDRPIVLPLPFLADTVEEMP